MVEGWGARLADRLVRGAAAGEDRRLPGGLHRLAALGGFTAVQRRQLAVHVGQQVGQREGHRGAPRDRGTSAGNRRRVLLIPVVTPGRHRSRSADSWTVVPDLLAEGSFVPVSLTTCKHVRRTDRRLERSAWSA